HSGSLERCGTLNHTGSHPASLRVRPHVDCLMYLIARQCQSAEPVHPKGAVTMSADSTLTCRDCGQAFTFTAGEQDFYASRGFSEPSRCPDCRAARKSQRDGGGSSYSSYGASYAGGGGGGGARRASREMLTATCSECGQEAQGP